MLFHRAHWKHLLLIVGSLLGYFVRNAHAGADDLSRSRQITIKGIRYYISPEPLEQPYDAFDEARNFGSISNSFRLVRYHSYDMEFFDHFNGVASKADLERFLPVNLMVADEHNNILIFNRTAPDGDYPSKRFQLVLNPMMPYPNKQRIDSVYVRKQPSDPIFAELQAPDNYKPFRERQVSATLLASQRQWKQYSTGLDRVFNTNTFVKPMRRNFERDTRHRRAAVRSLIGPVSKPNESDDLTLGLTKFKRSLIESRNSLPQHDTQHEMEQLLERLQHTEFTNYTADPENATRETYDTEKKNNSVEDDVMRIIKRYRSRKNNDVNAPGS